MTVTRITGGSSAWRAAARRVAVSTLVPLVLSAAACTAQNSFGSPDLGGHRLRITDDGRALEFSGGITFGVTKEVRAILDKDASIRTLRLNSLGGRVQEARLLADLLHQRGVATYAAHPCLSACAIVFMGGAQRVVAPGGQIGFHRDRDAYGTKVAIDDANDTERATLIDEGVAPWFADRAYSTPSESMWVPSQDELMRAHVVTDVIAQAGPASAPGQRPEAEPDVGAQVDAEFQTIAVFATIKTAAPETYEKIRTAMIDAITHKRSAAELGAAVAPYMQSLTRTYLPTASDAAIIEFAKVITLELSEIAAHSPEDCYNFGYRPPGAKTFDVLPFLSTEILLREQAALAAVIGSKSEPPPRLPTDKEITPSRNYVMERLLDKYGAADMDAYADARSPQSDHTKVCRMTIAFYNEAFALPYDEQARLLRFLLVRSYNLNGG